MHESSIIWPHFHPWHAWNQIEFLDFVNILSTLILLHKILPVSTLMLINVCSIASDSRGFNYGLQPGSSIVCHSRWSDFPSIFALVGSPLMLVMTCLSDRLSDDELRATVEFWPDSQWHAYLPLLHYCRVSGVRLMACGVPPEVHLWQNSSMHLLFPAQSMLLNAMLPCQQKVCSVIVVLCQWVAPSLCFIFQHSINSVIISQAQISLFEWSETWV